jgi:hypothetical protein
LARLADGGGPFSGDAESVLLRWNQGDISIQNAIAQNSAMLKFMNTKAVIENEPRFEINEMLTGNAKTNYSYKAIGLYTDGQHGLGR